MPNGKSPANVIRWLLPRVRCRVLMVGVNDDSLNHLPVSKPDLLSELQIMNINQNGHRIYSQLRKCSQLVKASFPFPFPYWPPVICRLFATILGGPFWQNTRMQILGTFTSAWELRPLVYAVSDQTGAFHDVC